MPERPQLPTDMKEFNRTLIEEFRANGGRLSGRRAGMQVLILTTTGARSGKPQTTVVGYRTDGDRYLVIASNNGASGHPNWYHNLLASPRAVIEVGAEKLDVNASIANPQEREVLGPKVEYLERQQQLTGRQIPLVILVPVRQAS